jgi:DNA-binding NarL/FixJ family response regulator
VTELLARDQETAAAIDVALGSARDLAVLVEGAAGIGKSVFLDAVLDGIDGLGAHLLVSRSTEAGAGFGFLGLHDLLAPVLGEALAVLPGPQRRSLEAALRIAEATGDVGADEAVTAVALVNALRALARRRAVVIAIDDVQWLDQSTASLLHVALPRLRAEAVRVVATVRDRSRPGGSLHLPTIYRDRLRTISLDGLSPGALHRLIGTRLGRSLPRPTLIHLHTATQGNPLYALELARSLPEGPAAADSLAAAVPPDVDALLGRRLEAVPREVRDVVSIVAVAARPSNETIARALEMPLDAVETAASAGIDAGLLRVETWGIGLAHPLIGNAAIARLRPPERRALHRRLSAVVDDPDRAAIHLSLATAGPDAAVADAVEAAAERGIARGATIEAVDLLDRAIAMTPASDRAAAVRRRVALAGALVQAGDTARSAAELAALDIDTIPDPALRADATLLLGVVERYTGDHASAIARHERALAWVTDPATRAKLHLRLAWLIERDLRAALDHATAALAAFDPVTSVHDHAFAQLLKARLELALGIGADHAAIERGAAVQSAAVRRDWDVSTIPIDWAIWMDDWTRARSLLEAAVPAAEDSGDETSLGHLLRRRVEVETWSGNLAVARRLADEAIERAEASHQVMSLASATARRGLILALAGDLDGADADGDVALSLAERHGNPVIQCYALTAVGAAARGRDAFDRADAALTRATEVLDATGDVDHPAYRFHGDHLDALNALGDVDRARLLVQRLERRGRLGPRPTWSAIAERGLAAIALAERRDDDASGHIEAALRLHAAANVPLETARTMLLAAQIDRRKGRRSAANTRLADAAAILTRVGAMGWAARAARDLARFTRDRAEIDTLTPSEQRIAELAVAGFRNREIAARLAISPKTVEAALARTYAKLGIRSRAQLATGLTRSARPGGPPAS